MPLSQIWEVDHLRTNKTDHEQLLKKFKYVAGIFLKAVEAFFDETICQSSLSLPHVKVWFVLKSIFCFRTYFIFILINALSGCGKKNTVKTNSLGHCKKMKTMLKLEKTYSFTRVYFADSKTVWLNLYFIWRLWVTFFFQFEHIEVVIWMEDEVCG